MFSSSGLISDSSVYRDRIMRVHSMLPKCQSLPFSSLSSTQSPLVSFKGNRKNVQPYTGCHFTYLFMLLLLITETRGIREINCCWPFGVVNQSKTYLKSLSLKYKCYGRPERVKLSRLSQSKRSETCWQIICYTVEAIVQHSGWYNYFNNYFILQASLSTVKSATKMKCIIVIIIII